MHWFLRGVQSAVFHYASCAPCTGYTESRRRRRVAKQAKKAREKLQLEQPEAYHHPEPTGTNPFWNEEIRLGPGPPPRRARRTNTTGSGCAARRTTTAGTQGSGGSKGGSGSSRDDLHRAHTVRLSDETLGESDDKWNRRRYQREDEELWGLDEPARPIKNLLPASTVNVAGFAFRRPGNSRSTSYASARAPPVNDLHPPVVSVPRPDPEDNRWMLQPPPRASVMAGKERARGRSRSGSGASSSVEVRLQRQISLRVLQHKVSHGEVPELLNHHHYPPHPQHHNHLHSNTHPSTSRTSLLSIRPPSTTTSITTAAAEPRSRTPQARPPSARSARRERKRRDTALSRTDTLTSRHEVGSSDSLQRVGVLRMSTPVATAGEGKGKPMLNTVVSSDSGGSSGTLFSRSERESGVAHNHPHGPTKITLCSEQGPTGHASTEFCTQHDWEAEVGMKGMRVPFDAPPRMDREASEGRDVRMRWSVDF